MTDRLYFGDGTHKDYVVIRDDHYSLSCYTENSDVDFYKKTELHECRLVRNVERYGAEEHMAQSSEATDSPSQATESDPTGDTPQPSTSDAQQAATGRKRLQQAMLDAGIDLDDVSVLHVPSDEVYRIELDDGVEDYDAIDAWTDSRFGKDKPGYIDWTEYEKDDGSTGYYPDAYCVPYDAFEDVVG